MKKIADIPVPAGYKRSSFNPASFSSWVQAMNLKTNTSIKKFNGTFIDHSYYNIFAVVDMPLLFTSDLEQCADYCMRFHAEYFKETNKLDTLYLFNYGGSRISFKRSNKNFIQFLKQAMGYSNSHSLKAGCLVVDKEKLAPGDMIVQNDTGGIGHVSMIVDVCEKNGSPQLYLIGFSFMPAQEFHIEKAPDKYGTGGWFTLDGYLVFLKAYYNYGTPVLRRFP